MNTLCEDCPTNNATGFEVNFNFCPADSGSAAVAEGTDGKGLIVRLPFSLHALRPSCGARTLSGRDKCSQARGLPLSQAVLFIPQVALARAGQACGTLTSSGGKWGLWQNVGGGQIASTKWVHKNTKIPEADLIGRTRLIFQLPTSCRLHSAVLHLRRGSRSNG
eukprot:scaffold910_cov396-Prasinococcus_capsulatus_cf.AAC.2